MGYLTILIISLAVGYAISKFVEVRHYASIRKRENETLNIPVLSSAKVFDGQNIKNATLVYSEYALATDFYKRYVLKILSFFGLNITVYEKLLDRARREAILRLKEKCKNFDAIINLKVETVEICNSNNYKKKVICLQILTSATAINF